MSVSSIDDAVEHWMVGASSVLTRRGRESWPTGPCFAPLQRALVVLAYIAVGSLFTPQFFFAVVLVLVSIGGVALRLRRMSQSDRT